MIKENRRIGNISAGPTSHLLEGVTWDEARRMQDASMSAATDHVILVGAASKGIIQRDFQHNAVVYKTPYAKNPFDAVTDQELEEYKELIERKQRGEPIEEIEIEKMNIMPERAMIDVVDDSMQDSTLNTTAPTSPTSDQEASSATVLKVETKQAPRASKAQSVVLSDDGEGVVRQKPSLPPKPNIPKKPAMGPGVPVGPPQRVQATMKTLPVREDDGVKAREPSPTLERSKSAFYKNEGETVANGDENEAHHSTVSHSSKEGSPTKDTSLTDDSISKDKKKKKKGLRTPSFLKKKKDKKKEKEAAHQ
ncbi:hypothetical protein OTU49_010367 [Cherax quadricarinatus]|uniref:Uncharacterized protein n=1 Tax=Cherax quadricarinatus TaxID=27406 RepID=A0AAW0YR83_CHEQU